MKKMVMNHESKYLFKNKIVLVVLAWWHFIMWFAS